MKMNPELPPLSDAQMEIMQRIWARGRATVTEVSQDLAQQREVARNTVLTVMDRLAKRGWLAKEAIGNVHVFTATVDQRNALGTLVGDLVASTFSGNPDRLIMALLDGRGLTADESGRIRKMIVESHKRKQ